MKLDIKWGYNNVWIREEDRWKGTFKTEKGLFEPNIMFFGMQNSPATFQNMMNDIMDKPDCQRSIEYLYYFTFYIFKPAPIYKNA